MSTSLIFTQHPVYTSGELRSGDNNRRSIPQKADNYDRSNPQELSSICVPPSVLGHWTENHSLLTAQKNRCWGEEPDQTKPNCLFFNRSYILTNLSLCLHICVSCSWHHVYIWERWWSDHIHVAAKWAAQHSSRPAGDGIQHPAQRSNPGASEQLLWVRWLSQTTHCKWTISLFNRIFYRK